MAKISFTPDNVIAQGVTFDRLKLKLGELARIVVLEDASYGWIHEIRAPLIGNDGKPVMEKYIPWGKDEPEERFKLKWISTVRCLGDEANLGPEGRGVDPEACPGCRDSMLGLPGSAPFRKHAVNVAKYTTKTGTHDIRLPFSAELLVWSFKIKIFNKLESLKREHGPLELFDLKLGPCEAPEEFQKFAIENAAYAEWQKDDAKTNRKDYIAQLLEEKVSDEDLDKSFGKKVVFEVMEKDLQVAHKLWAVANGQEKAETAEAVSKDLNNILSGKAKSAPPAPVTEDDDDSDDTPAEPKAKLGMQSVEEMLSKI